MLELVEKLWAGSKYARCGELIQKYLGTFVNPQMSAVPLEVECFVRCGRFLLALEASEANQILKPRSIESIRNGLKVAVDIKRNAVSNAIADFDKKYLRLRIVQ